MIPKYMPKYARSGLIFMKDFKRVRSQMTPIFTSGKLKQMYRNFGYPIDNCVANIEELIDARKGDSVEVKKLVRSVV